ncbi:hypothetical protein FBQ97_10505 [Acidobacteria bacterium ACD]|nr:hypothetical protein [Acidobacteria bacterium ACD]
MRSSILAVLLWALVVALPAEAYLDPNASSVLLQLVLGGLAGVAIAMKMFWGHIRAFFGRRPSRPPTTESGGK